MILLNFIASIFQTLQGIWGALALVVHCVLYTGSGFLFMYAALPDRRHPSHRWMLGSMMAASSLYMALARLAPNIHWMLTLAAISLGLCPLVVTLLSVRSGRYPLRWLVVTIYAALSIFLLGVQNRRGYDPNSGPDVVRHAVMFAVFFCCFLFISFTYRRATVGAFITIAGFFCWAMTFVITPLMRLHLPQVQFEKEVWDLPKFVVAVGMLLILLEDQIGYNKHLALHDELTGLPNRRLFQDRMLSALDRARRTNAQAALLVIDLNHFKEVNDTCGHHVGDLLLQKVGSIFSGRVRRSDTVARTGGDEFSVILEEPTSRADAAYVCQALVDLLKEPLLLEDHLVQTGASIGVAVFPEDASDMESLFIAADQRMYEEKHRLAMQSGQETARIANLLPQ
ncbi:MAG: GGDEF domain-containing protein [Terracidiphilus sp.]